MVTCKKLVTVGVWAQVDQHSTSSNVGGSTHVKVIEVFHNSPFFLNFQNFYSFCARYQLFTEGAMGCTNEIGRLNIFLIYSHSSIVVTQSSLAMNHSVLSFCYNLNNIYNSFEIIIISIRAN
jgi:hypothetical protein